MDRSLIPPLAEVLEFYYSYHELMEAASIFDVTFFEESVWRGGQFNWLAAARQLVEQIDHGNHFNMLESLLMPLKRNATNPSRESATTTGEWSLFNFLSNFAMSSADEIMFATISNS